MLRKLGCNGEVTAGNSVSLVLVPVLGRQIKHKSGTSTTKKHPEHELIMEIISRAPVSISLCVWYLSEIHFTRDVCVQEYCEQNGNSGGKYLLRIKLTGSRIKLFQISRNLPGTEREKREIRDFVLTYFLISGLISSSNPSVFCQQVLSWTWDK